MANRQRGEVDVTVDGRPYRLSLVFEAYAQIEDLVGQDFDVIIESMVKGRMSGLRNMVWCALWDAHGPAISKPRPTTEEIKTLRDASDWIDRLGGPRKATALLNELLARIQEANEKDADPQPAQADGTGEPSTSGLAALA